MSRLCNVSNNPETQLAKQHRTKEVFSIPGRVIPKTLKWFLIPPCLTLSIIRHVSRVKYNNPGKGVVPSPTPQCSSY